MGRLKKFANLPHAERALLLRVLFRVAAVRLGLWVLPFRVLRRVALPAKANFTDAAPSVARLAWAVTVVSRYVPRATCLTQALAGQGLLAREGYESRLELGFAKDGQRPFEAHAWLVCGDQIVLGGPTVERYTPMAAWEAGQ